MARRRAIWLGTALTGAVALVWLLLGALGLSQAKHIVEWDGHCSYGRTGWAIAQAIVVGVGVLSWFVALTKRSGFWWVFGWAYLIGWLAMVGLLIPDSVDAPCPA